MNKFQMFVLGIGIYFYCLYAKKKIIPVFYAETGIYSCYLYAKNKNLFLLFYAETGIYSCHLYANNKEHIPVVCTQEYIIPVFTPQVLV